MSRIKTLNAPDLSALLVPQNALMLAVEETVLRGHDWSRAAAPVADQIAARIAGVITLDLVHAGQRLLEQDISVVLHVSRAPVREALRILERDRLVQFEPRRGATVTAPDAQELRDIFAVRLTLYDELLKVVMRECPGQLQSVLEQHLQRLVQRSRESADAYAVGSFQLNIAIADLCSNRLLVDLLKSVSLRTLRYVRLARVRRPASIVQALASWQMWLDAVTTRDIPFVRQLAERRILEMRDVAVEALLPGTAPADTFADPGRAPPAGFTGRPTGRSRKAALAT